MAKEFITIEIDEEGAVQYEVTGVKGAKCKQVTAELDKALGGNGTSTPTKEFHETPQKEKLKHKA